MLNYPVLPDGEHSCRIVDLKLFLSSWTEKITGIEVLYRPCIVYVFDILGGPLDGQRTSASIICSTWQNFLGFIKEFDQLGVDVTALLETKAQGDLETLLRSRIINQQVTVIKANDKLAFVTVGNSSSSSPEAQSGQ